VFDAVVHAGVPTLIHGSSVAVYNRGPEDAAVNEQWPIGGIPTSHYCRQKAEVERILDAVEHEEPRLRVVRMRPALTFKRQAAAHIHRVLLGSFVPRLLFDRRLLQAAPTIGDLLFQ